jgi:hypothetical protein
MRVLLASLFMLAVGPTAAQQNPADIPAAFLSPTLMEGWQLQPIYPNGAQSLQMALAWADAPHGRFVPYSVSAGELLGGAEQFNDRGPAIAAPSRRSTVGQGGDQSH